MTRGVRRGVPGGGIRPGNPPPDLGALMLSTSSHMAVGVSREAVYASTAALHASSVVWLEVAAFTYWTVLLNCRHARGHDSAYVAK